MGLDMYLSRRPIDIEDDCYDAQVGYWRKAYPIFDWIEKNVCDGITENCVKYEFSEEALIDLRNSCQKVMNLAGIPFNIKEGVYECEKLQYPCQRQLDVSLVLPICDAGCYDASPYNINYFEMVSSTYRQINDILECTDFDNYVIYYHAWW